MEMYFKPNWKNYLLLQWPQCMLQKPIVFKSRSIADSTFLSHPCRPTVLQNLHNFDKLPFIAVTFGQLQQPPGSKTFTKHGSHNVRLCIQQVLSGRLMWVTNSTISAEAIKPMSNMNEDVSKLYNTGHYSVNTIIIKIKWSIYTTHH